jgi:hypothetical protein
MQLEAQSQLLCLLGWKCLVMRSFIIRIEVIFDQNNLLGCREYFLEKEANGMRRCMGGFF